VNVGDLVRRKNISPWRKTTHRRRKLGIVLSTQMGGINPSRECLTVLYPEDGEVWEIAKSLMEAICETQQA